MLQLPSTLLATLCLGAAHTRSRAGTTLTRTCGHHDVGILWAIGMILRAVGLRAMAIAPQQVLPHRDRLQVCWPVLVSDGLDARLRGAAVRLDVIELLALGDRADQQLVGEAMGINRLASDGDPAVAVLAFRSNPQPARLSLMDLGPEAADLWRLRRVVGVVGPGSAGHVRNCLLLPVLVPALPGAPSS